MASEGKPTRPRQRQAAVLLKPILWGGRVLDAGQPVPDDLTAAARERLKRHGAIK